ncbi:MAG: OmpA family protein [Myxococcales bacterium]|nr:OmpA family protein [Myxococcales bacterium]
MRGKPSISALAGALALALGCAPSHPPGPSEPEWSTAPTVTAAAPGGAAGASATDDDGDGITAWNDLCPDRAEDPDDVEDDDGCPDLDDDEDGRPDSEDGCPEIAAATADGCPAGGAVTLADAAAQAIGFRPGKADLDVAARQVLDAVAATMAAHPEVEQLDLIGYRAASERHDGLDLRRAQVAARYLESQGVAAARLAVRGDGVAPDAAPLKARVEVRVRLAVQR